MKRQNSFSMISKLSNLDLFAMRPQVMLEGRTKYPTVSGFLLSVIMFVVFLFFLVLFLTSVFQREKVNVSMSEVFHKSPLNKTLDPKDFNLSITMMQRILYTYNYYIDPTIIDISMMMLISSISPLTEAKSHMNQTYIPLEVEDCDNSQKGTKLCLKNSEWNRKTMQLQTSYEFKESKNLVVVINPCNNLTLLFRNITQYVCKSQAEIDSVLASSVVGIGFDTNTLDTRNYLNPIDKCSNIYMIGTVNESTKYFEVKLQGGRLKTDQGIFKEDIIDTEFIIMHSKALDMTNRGESTLFVASFAFDNVEKVYHRNYENLFDVLAKISGIWKFLTIVISFFAAPLARLGYFEKLALFLEERNAKDDQQKEINQLKQLVNQFKKIKLMDRLIYVSSLGLVKTKNMEFLEDSRKSLENIFDLTNFLEVHQFKMKGKKFKDSKTFKETSPFKESTTLRESNRFKESSALNELSTFNVEKVEKVGREARIKIPKFEDYPMEGLKTNKVSIDDV